MDDKRTSARRNEDAASPGPSETIAAVGEPRNPAAGLGRERERLRTVVVDDADDLAILLADRIVSTIQREIARKDRCVLGLATGSTPIGIYRELIRRYRAGEISFAKVVTFNLDEYYSVHPDSLHSYHRYMRENLFDHIDLPDANIHVPDGTLPRASLDDACAAFESEIARVGGIDFQILGIGRSGHIGFNEPGSGAETRTRLITLDRVTRKDAAGDFFGEENVPREAITMGVATILDAREIALIATGEHKAAIVARAVEGSVSSAVAATYLQGHGNATVYLDLPAASALTRIRTPWLVQSVEWDAGMTERAVIWLAERREKAILKLSAGDYADEHLSPLLARHGEPGPINGQVFNRLSAKIRGRRSLPMNSKVLVFSPHPDDDVISMGGILRKLQQNMNEIVVAYMTSGNIAVFDHDVRRHVDFVERAARTLRLDHDRVSERRAALEDALAAKSPGDVDSADIQDLKRWVRESEAVAALDALGVPTAAARFLNLPFYRTGEVRKRPVGEEDVEIVASLISEIEPAYAFVAGDLSDPHGTHRMCKAAIDRALARCEGRTPEVWLYRGAWEEWPLPEADVLVPLSDEELRRKITAIFRHQSQKDTAPFPGGHDDREFWQRVRDRNIETAARADRLGLPEYYAMEAYVILPAVPVAES
jgi:glucosamine-6-phosphate deaminase